MLTPKARGALSEALFEAMRTSTGDVPPLSVEPESPEDAQIALWALYELHYRGFEDVEESLEWDPVLLQLRQRLERDLESRLRERCLGQSFDQSSAHSSGEPFAEAFFDAVAAHDGASLAEHVHRRASVDEVLDLLRLRSVYHLKESDPTAWVVPRLPVGVKAALMELQFDEYGCGDPNRLHAHMFAVGMEACGLRPEYGGYVDDVPLEVLEQNNAMSLFGLHRRLRGAALGHLAAFEATSSLPSRRMAQGLARVGLAPEMVRLLRGARRRRRGARAAGGPLDLRCPGRARAGTGRRRVLRGVHGPRPGGPARPPTARPVGGGPTGPAGGRGRRMSEARRVRPPRRGGLPRRPAAAAR